MVHPVQRDRRAPWPFRQTLRKPRKSTGSVHGSLAAPDIACDFSISRHRDGNGSGWAHGTPASSRNIFIFREESSRRQVLAARSGSASDAGRFDVLLAATLIMATVVVPHQPPALAPACIDWRRLGLNWRRSTIKERFTRFFKTTMPESKIHSNSPAWSDEGFFFAPFEDLIVSG